jgi:fibronectin-binding autotransporter adhesin
MKNNPSARVLVLSLGLAVAGLSQLTQAADVIHTATTTGSTNWTAATWANNTPDLTSAGDQARYSGSALGTYTLDTDVAIGDLTARDSGGGWTILSNGSNTLTMDATGLSGANQDFGNAGVAAIANNNGNASAARVFAVGSSGTGMNINMATDLDIGIAANTGSNLNTFGVINNTSGSAKTLIFRENSNAGSSGAPNMTINSSIGTGGNSTLALVNSGTGGNSITRGVVTISGTIGSNVTTVTQNSATSPLTLNAANSYTGGTLVNAGILSVGPAGTLGTGSISLSDTTGVILTLGNANAIADSAILRFGSNSTINLNAGSGTSETIFALFDTTTQTFHTTGTFTAAQLNSDFGGISTFANTSGETVTIVAAVPEPSTWAMLLGGAGMLGFYRGLRRNSSKA